MSVDRYPVSDELVFIKCEGANAAAALVNYGSASGDWSETNGGITKITYQQAGAFGASNAAKFINTDQTSNFHSPNGQAEPASITALWRGNLDSLSVVTGSNIQLFEKLYGATWTSPYGAIGAYVTSGTGEINAFVTISGSIHAYTTSGTMSTGADTVVTVTFDGTTLKAYKNKTNILSQAISGAIDYGSSKEWFTGFPTPGSAQEGFLGTVSELRIFDNVKDQTWINTYYDYVAPPPLSVTSVSPLAGVAGSTLHIYGVSFDAACTCTVGGVSAAVTFISSTHISVVLGAHSAPALVDVVVTNP